MLVAHAHAHCRILACLLLSLDTACVSAPNRPIGDFHQHLFGPGALELSPGLTRVTARNLVAMLDSAGIRRALVLSIAYQFSNPNRPPVANEYARVMAENDWTAEQVAEFPRRLVAFCSLSPIRDYALQEIERCAADPRLRRGLKLHIGNSDVDFENPDHLARTKAVFRAANAHGMAIVIHLRPSVTRNRPYGERIARIFLTDVLPSAPDIPIQIAHLGGSGGLADPGAEEALDYFIRAIAEDDVRMKNVYFDVSLGFGDSPELLSRTAVRIRQIGLGRILFGSDGAVGGNSPLAYWRTYRRLPLTEQEFAIIERNVPPYMK